MTIGKEIEWKNNWFRASIKDIAGNKFEIEAFEKHKSEDLLLNMEKNKGLVWQIIYYLIKELYESEKKIAELEKKNKTEEEKSLKTFRTFARV